MRRNQTEHTECPTCGAGLEWNPGNDPEQYCIYCLAEDRAQRIDQQKNEITRLRAEHELERMRVPMKLISLAKWIMDNAEAAPKVYIDPTARGQWRRAREKWLTEANDLLL
jgi:hypothetical protein